MAIKMTYENFDIYLNRRNEDAYHVEVKTKDCGEYSAYLRFPFSRAELSERVDNIYKAIQGIQGKLHHLMQYKKLGS